MCTVASFLSSNPVLMLSTSPRRMEKPEAFRLFHYSADEKRDLKASTGTCLAKQVVRVGPSGARSDGDEASAGPNPSLSRKG